MIKNMSSGNKAVCIKCGTGNYLGSSYCSKCGSILQKESQSNPSYDNIQNKNSPNSDTATKNIVFSVFRCGKTSKDFGVKMVETSIGSWSLTSVSPIENGLKAYHEKLDIEGTFETDDYDGCPYCEALGAIRCFCGRVFCWNRKKKTNTCPWCHESGIMAEGSVNNLKAGDDM